LEALFGWSNTMKSAISRLVGRYESGTLTRRELVSCLAMLMATGSAASALGGQLKTDNFWTGKTDNF
jgi:hypothetical protein